MGYNPFDYIGTDKRKRVSSKAMDLAQGVIGEHKLREMIREEIQKLNEGSMGKFGKDESDVFGGIVRMNKKKKPKDILKIVSKDKFLAKNIKRMRISNQELLDYIEDELEFFQFS